MVNIHAFNLMSMGNLIDYLTYYYLDKNFYFYSELID